MNLDDKKKAYIMGVISVFAAIGLFYVVFAAVNYFTNNRVSNDDPFNASYDELYGTVSDIKDGYIIVKPIDEEMNDSVKVETEKEFSIGDFIFVQDDEIKVIANNKELDDVTSTVKPTSKKTIKRPSTTTTKPKTTEKTTEKTSKPSISYNEDDVISYVENVNNEVENSNSNMSFKDKVKDKFILIVDFIFYDGEIKGYKFDELSNNAKAKVIYYALKIDSKINDLWPNYKEIIGDKVSDIKAKLIAKYMDISTTICSKYPEDCQNVKNDFQLLKSSLSVTWDVVKSAFKYGYGKTTDYLKTWYEVFSGK